MPELPEVETIKLGLTKKIIGLKITQIEVLNPKSFEGDPQLLIGKQVLKVDRRGKVLIWKLEGELNLLFHLKMSGQLILANSSKLKAENFFGGHPNIEMRMQMPVKSTRVIFALSNGAKVYFNDQRKFGWVKIFNLKELEEFAFFKKLGPEPLTADFTLELFKTRLLKRRKTAIKPAILDQEVLAGIGNIYACEALFVARVNPKRVVGELTNLEIKNLHQAVIQVLGWGIEHGGSSRTHYVNTEGIKGSFLTRAFVYNREKQSCKKCGELIKRVVVGGRGTFFCPNCQR